MRILWAVDGSEHSQWGIQALETLASQEPEQVGLLHIIDQPALQAATNKNPVAAKRALAAMEKAGTIVLLDAARSARLALGQAATGPRTKLQTILLHGPIAHTIARTARRLKADLILMGSRGLSDIQGFLLGSVSRHDHGRERSRWWCPRPRRLCRRRLQTITCCRPVSSIPHPAGIRQGHDPDLSGKSCY